MKKFSKKFCTKSRKKFVDTKVSLKIIYILGRNATF